MIGFGVTATRIAPRPGLVGVSISPEQAKADTTTTRSGRNERGACLDIPVAPTTRMPWWLHQPRQAIVQSASGTLGSPGVPHPAQRLPRAGLLCDPRVLRVHAGAAHGRSRLWGSR